VVGVGASGGWGSGSSAGGLPEGPAGTKYILRIHSLSHDSKRSS
jgi:hypothetical protein